jgi:lipoyl(octanoyl) transferase
MNDRLLHVVRLGLVQYGEALRLQREVARARLAGEVEQDVLLLVEHPPVVTLGRTAKAGHLVASPGLLRARGVEVHEVERGGDVTFHGPGQLVGYPVFDLDRHRKDLHWYLRQVEGALIRAIEPWGIRGCRSPGYTGVWVGDATRGHGAEPSGDADRAAPRDHSIGGGTPRKLASIGVHARGWVTWHGFALNVATDLAFFDLIVPCGIQGVRMTSMTRELGRDVAVREVEDAAARAFGETFALEPVETPLAGLAPALAAR